MTNEAGHKLYSYRERFDLELGGALDYLEIAYHTYGKLNSDKSNVVWVFHALTANSDASEWWNGLIGKDAYFNPEEYFIVCANILGSCYGTTGPLSENPATRTPYFHNFPKVTIRDMVNAHKLLQRTLGISSIKYGIGGSMGGYQLMEWAFQDQYLFENLILLATSAKESTWGNGIHATQRAAIENDASWLLKNEKAGEQGMKIARAIGLLTYRNYQIFEERQSDPNPTIGAYKAESYLKYQGDKLAKRFNAFSYWHLSHAMDTHNLARDRDDLPTVLAEISAKCLVIGLTSDILCPIEEQIFISKHISRSIFFEINSPYGHDGFLIETKKIELILKSYF